MTRERVAQYQEILNTEGTTLARLEEERIEAQNQIAEAEEAIKTLQEELKELTEDMEEKTKRVEEVKKTTASLTREAESRSLGGLVEARQLVPSHEAYT